MLGILSDAHGNHKALGQAIEILQSLGAIDFAYLGDAIGYIPSSSVVRQLRTMKNLQVCLRGNHEDMLLNNRVSSEREAIYQLGLTSKFLSKSDLYFLSLLPTSQQMQCGAGKLFFVHGSPVDNTYGYVYPDTDLDQFETDANYVFMGNTHRPFQRSVGATTYINVGSCGLPRDDGRFGAAVLFNPANGASRIIRYDITDNTKLTLKTSPAVHDTVLHLFDRESQSIEGDFV
jgi:predicted phosphodiesterase